MRKKRQVARDTGKSSTPTVDAASVASSPTTAPRGASGAAADRGDRGLRAPGSLLDTIEPNTTPGELVGLLVMILAFPTVVSLIVRYVVLSYVF